ncbi:hypothetical protein [Streptomyces sp. NRRL S-1022]|uniref:hypothetical protein n=1 Tax=Streptomyces sp. NRRL S-1022 TaxID=1463880 RepID=UPI00131C69A9|nr:hypothetical protein [Streptomyces sp. NRRL S-1022]
MRAEVRVLGFLAAASWLVAAVAFIDWLNGNPSAPTGIATFVVTGALFTGLAIYLHRSDQEKP